MYSTLAEKYSYVAPKRVIYAPSGVWHPWPFGGVEASVLDGIGRSRVAYVPQYDVEVHSLLWEDMIWNCNTGFANTCGVSTTDDVGLPIEASPVLREEKIDALLAFLGPESCPVGAFSIEYFPLALIYVAHLSYVCNEQHNPGQPMHWARGKSTDHTNKLLRHFLRKGTKDTDGILHSGKVVWRAMAALEEELEKLLEEVSGKKDTENK